MPLCILSDIIVVEQNVDKINKIKEEIRHFQFPKIDEIIKKPAENILNKLVSSLKQFFSSFAKKDIIKEIEEWVEKNVSIKDSKGIISDDLTDENNLRKIKIKSLLTEAILNKGEDFFNKLKKSNCIININIRWDKYSGNGFKFLGDYNPNTKILNFPLDIFSINFNGAYAVEDIINHELMHVMSDLEVEDIKHPDGGFQAKTLDKDPGAPYVKRWRSQMKEAIQWENKNKGRNWNINGAPEGEWSNDNPHVWNKYALTAPGEYFALACQFIIGKNQQDKEKLMNSDPEMYGHVISFLKEKSVKF